MQFRMLLLRVQYKIKSENTMLFNFIKIFMVYRNNVCKFIII